MIEVRQHPDFKAWLDALRDKAAQRKIAQRIVRVQAGLLGDAKFFGGIGELRVDFGPGYRIYFVKRGTEIIILLCGGDKSSQRKDIIRARKLADRPENTLRIEFSFAKCGSRKGGLTRPQIAGQTVPISP